MQSWKMIAVAVTVVILGAVVTAAALAYYASGQSQYGTPFGAPYSNYGSQTWGRGGMGMMGGGGMMGGQGTYRTSPTFGNPTTTYGGQWGCHGAAMHSGVQPYYSYYVANTTSISINQAAALAQQYLLSLNNPDLAIGEVEEYTLNFYVEYYEKSTGIGAFEMLLDKYSGRIYPEMGPNMMWNTKYGMMTEMMGRWGTKTAPMTVTVEQAGALTQQYLNANLPQTSVGEVMPFYGYYDVHVLASGKTYGMLSVNGYTGQVWYHTWHGDFIQEWEP